MKIWRLDFPAEEEHLDVYIDGFGVEKQQEFDGRRHDDWREAKLEIDGSDLAVRPNCPYYWAPIPVWDNYARDVLDDLVDGEVQFLPAELDGKRYWIVNVTNLLDALDWERSDYELFDDGGIKWVKEYQLKEDVVRGQSIFKLSDDPLDFPFVSEELKQRAEERGITGLRFRLAWDSELPSGSVRFSFLE